MLLDPTYQTFRAELWELNELNYARFEAKLEQRLAELRADVLLGFSELRAELLEAGTVHEPRKALRGIRGDLQQLRSDLLRWMFGFWITNLIILASLMLALHD